MTPDKRQAKIADDKTQHSQDQGGSAHNLTEVLEAIEPDNDSGKSSIGDIMEALESRGFGPLLFAPALIAVMPTGGIPGVPTVCGVIIALLSVQMIMGKNQPWLPNFINKIEFDKEKLDKGVSIATKVTKKIDKVSKPRLQKLSSQGAKKGVAAVCILAALSMIPLEAVPFAVMVPATSIILFAIGLITKDGYITLAALLLNIATLYFLVTTLMGG
ncbi:exopolysaccharide biosynthesis protein [Psychrobacter sp. FDAARGOS_221]|uniref:exopolysaccharide biosynthesis protein n=1 Tax=Psychrobacter sp. FDAARGOS_221 TaxID=1975705 RepID=UPI000BB55F4B|nr:exopolysaccharide biosynthesis protein [Psychrobacter sp. FDAARGOS_221]PNK61039.1 exopolysaccharide biosynthesis protein exod [Psychrobacter sp. FDAARGOS_221]